MRCLKVLALFLALGGSLMLAACGGQATTVMCFGPRPVSSVHSVGNSVSFTVTTIQRHLYLFCAANQRSAVLRRP